MTEETEQGIGGLYTLLGCLHVPFDAIKKTIDQPYFSELASCAISQLEHSLFESIVCSNSSEKISEFASIDVHLGKPIVASDTIDEYRANSFSHIYDPDLFCFVCRGTTQLPKGPCELRIPNVKNFSFQQVICAMEY